MMKNSFSLISSDEEGVVISYILKFFNGMNQEIYAEPIVIKKGQNETSIIDPHLIWEYKEPENYLKIVEPEKLNQKYYDIYNKNDKFSLLVHLLKNSTPGLAIVFCATRKETDIVARNLRRQGINASEIHGGMNQNKRLRSLESLKKQTTDVLVATDVAARGLDIKDVSHVYNYDVPKTPKEYIHRIGRTARAGKNGDAVTLLTSPDHENFRRVQSDEKLCIKQASFPKFNKVPFLRSFKKRRRQYFKKY
jgi:ATP-dependent RNA helicase DeaD